jgi:hypothetical protein
MAHRPPDPGNHQKKKIQTETSFEHKKQGTREERPSFLILCEGKTERDYFAGMRSRRGPQIDVDMPEVDHLSVVREAVNRQSAEYTAVWCVLDTELDEGLTAAMAAEAKQGAIRLCLSTPSFEVWLIMHLSDCTRPFQSANEAKRRLKSVAPSWREGNTKFSDFSKGVDDACRRARRIDPTGEDVLKNPSSNAWKLVVDLQGQTD